MIFASPVFLFLFLPLFLAVYYLAPYRARSGVIVVGSAVFYGWWRIDFLILLYWVIGWSWLCGYMVEKYRDEFFAKWILRAGVCGNLLTLGYFKYFNLSASSLNGIFVRFGAPSFEFTHVILPIGVSFFVFHGISYIVDVWRRDVAATKNLFDFAAFISLFPHLIAGPVLRYKDLAWQFASRRHGFDLFSEGCYRFMSGFAKKVLIADTVAPLADSAFALAHPSFADAWTGAAAYAIQILFDFAGYSEMAVGLALMMGFRFIENFNNPYISQSITEFWRRWHISLSTWLRDYLYIPLGGNRKGKIRTYINLFLTMLLGGLWHGANWTFVLWGGWHGVLLAAERKKAEIYKAREQHAKPHSIPQTPATSGAALPDKNPAHRFFAHVYLIVAVLIGWVLFRAESFTAALRMYAGMSGLNGTGLSDSFAWQVKYISLSALFAGIALVFILPYFEKYRERVPLSEGSAAVKTDPPLAMQLTVTALFLIAVSRLIAMSYSPFLYFQF